MSQEAPIEARAGLRNSLSGKVKELAGTVTANKALTAEGQLQRAEAKGQSEADARAASADTDALRGRCGPGRTAPVATSARTEREEPAATVRPAAHAPGAVAPLPGSGPHQQIAPRDQPARDIGDRPPAEAPVSVGLAAAARRLTPAPVRTLQRCVEISQLIRYGESRSALVPTRAHERCNP